MKDHSFQHKRITLSALNLLLREAEIYLGLHPLCVLAHLYL